MAVYADACSWRAGKNLSACMSGCSFSDWERVIEAFDGEDIAGYCTMTKTDCIPDVSYTPYIGSLFVGETYRGNRLGGRLIRTALDYAEELGFEAVYLVSDHVGLYEKYGFSKIDEKPVPWNPTTIETIFKYTLEVSNSSPSLK